MKNQKTDMENQYFVPLKDKICLTISEAAAYSGFTEKAIKDIIADNPDNDFTVYNEAKQGRSQLIKREEFEKFIHENKF